MARALIGVSASLHDYGNYGGVGIQRPLLAAGALPVSSLRLPEAVPDTLAPLAGVVLAPERDIDPARYGQRADALLAATEPRRDEFELALVEAALDRGLPVSAALDGTAFRRIRVTRSPSPGRASSPPRSTARGRCQLRGRRLPVS